MSDASNFQIMILSYLSNSLKSPKTYVVLHKMMINKMRMSHTQLKMDDEG